MGVGMGEGGGGGVVRVTGQYQALTRVMPDSRFSVRQADVSSHLPMRQVGLNVFMGCSTVN